MAEAGAQVQPQRSFDQVLRVQDRQIRGEIRAALVDASTMTPRGAKRKNAEAQELQEEHAARAPPTPSPSRRPPVRRARRPPVRSFREKVEGESGPLSERDQRQLAFLRRQDGRWQGREMSSHVWEDLIDEWVVENFSPEQIDGWLQTFIAKPQTKSVKVPEAASTRASARAAHAPSSAPLQSAKDCHAVGEGRAILRYPFSRTPVANLCCEDVHVADEDDMTLTVLQLDGRQITWWNQGRSKGCHICSLSSSLSFCGDLFFANQLMDQYNTMTHCREISKATQPVAFIYNLFEGINGWTMTRIKGFMRADVFKPHQYPTLVTLIGSDGSLNHCVTLLQDQIFDSNHHCPLPLTQASLDACVRLGGADSIRFANCLKAYSICPMKSMKKKVDAIINQSV